MREKFFSLFVLFGLFFLLVLLNLRLKEELQCTKSRLNDFRRALLHRQAIDREIQELEEILEKGPRLTFPNSETQKYEAFLNLMDKLSALGFKFSLSPRVGEKLEKSYSLSVKISSDSWEPLKILLGFFASVNYPVVKLSSLTISLKGKKPEIKVKATIYTEPS